MKHINAFLPDQRGQRQLLPGHARGWTLFRPWNRHVGNAGMVGGEAFYHLLSIHENGIFMLSRLPRKLREQEPNVPAHTSITIILTVGEQLRIYADVHCSSLLNAI